MTSPSTPGDALSAAGRRLTAQREAARRVSQAIADQRATEAARPAEQTPERPS